RRRSSLFFFQMGAPADLSLGSKSTAITYDKILFFVFRHTSSVFSDLKWQVNHSRFDSVDLNRRSRGNGFAPNIPQSQASLRARGRNTTSRSNFSQHASFRLMLTRRRGALEFEAGELAMDLASRANTFHDLLADITALVEIECLLLLGLMRQIAVANI